eukprot:TRINITY_DN2136_c0_g1_i1.p1 TRINITY_DN2136_c0_g1~~TRINITY_DN2136_c0_g1_i1.p1  ORF type:complete len:292 (-),score=84.65 TRINITY_DN2136_c0_g1_i1:36-911(-)
MFDLVDQGFTTFDGADIYGPAEDLMGEFRKRLKARDGNDLNFQSFTKWVPRPGPMTRAVAEAAIRKSLNRMQTDSLDLVQFHWWDYSDPRYIDALKQLSALKEEGMIKQIGLTNFDTKRLKEIVGAGIDIASNQVSFSIIDQRPKKEMIPFCKEKQISILAYGTLLGGFFSEKYLGKSVPKADELDTSSLKKYYRFIVQFGGWDLFQELLQTMKKVADRHHVSVANVACRYVMQQPMVGGVIVGVRLGLSHHIEDNKRILEFELTSDDLSEIDGVVARGRPLPGDCGDEYR